MPFEEGKAAFLSGHLTVTINSDPERDALMTLPSIWLAKNCSVYSYVPLGTNLSVFTVESGLGALTFVTSSQVLLIRVLFCSCSVLIPPSPVHLSPRRQPRIGTTQQNGGICKAK